jgi:hypothetical protein
MEYSYRFAHGTLEAAIPRMITPAAKTRVAMNAKESPTRSSAEEDLTSFTFLLAAFERCQPDTKKAAVKTAIEAKTTSKEV